MDKSEFWRCLHCKSPLTQDASGQHCENCGRGYPKIEGVRILVREPAAYLQSELETLVRAARGAKQRWDFLASTGSEVGLTDVSIARHRDVIETEIAQTETFLALLEKTAGAAAELSGNTHKTTHSRRAGWAFETLIPYLLRDWTNTSELESASSIINAALKHALPDPSGRSVVLAGCGAGGMLAEITSDFGRVIGFDLTLAVVQAARHLLDGQSLDIALPRCINESGRITLRKRDAGSDCSHVELLAMDVFDTAFADGSIDCVVTSFLIDLLPDPRRLADEMHRILRNGGVWINYGPSGPLKALWHFDEAEGAAFFESVGFDVARTGAYRATYLDISRDCPLWSFQNHICYLTSARKMAKQRAKTAAPPAPRQLADSVPQLYPGATLIQRQRLGNDQRHLILLRHQRIPGRAESAEISIDDAEIFTLVDGKRTVREIASLLKETLPAQEEEQTIRAFADYFERGLLSWRDEDRLL